MKKLTIWILCLMVVLSQLHGLPAFAAGPEEDTGVGAEVPDGGQASDTEGGGRSISASRNMILFPDMVEGDGSEPEEFSIINDGDVPVYIRWSQADGSGAFELSALSDADSELNPGQGIDFQVSLSDDLPAGDYSATFVFQDEDDPPATEEVSFYVKVKAKQDGVDGSKQEEEDQSSWEPDPEDKGEDKTDPGSSDAIYTYQLLAVCQPDDGGFVAGEGDYADGDNATLVAFENDGFAFEGWYLDGQKVSDLTELDVTDIHSELIYTAAFKRMSYRIKVRSKNDKLGTVSGSGDYTEGDEALLEAKPKKGFVFAGWYEKGKLVSKDSAFTVSGIDQDHSYVASFKPEEHTVRVSAYPQGAGTVTGSGKVKHKGSARLTAEPQPGYEFAGFYINNKLITEKDTYTLQKIHKDVSVTARFDDMDEDSFEMRSGIANQGGSISPSGKIEIKRHGSITYTFAPDNGYAVQEVAVDGKKIGPCKSYTFEDIQDHHRISVAFAPIKDNENGVKKFEILTEEEAEKLADARLELADYDEEGRSSDVITPEMYNAMKEEGTLKEALAIPKQDRLGMDDADDLPDQIDSSDYHQEPGLFQKLDISPEEAKKMIKEGRDDGLIKASYEAGYLTILINNQYLIPGKEEQIDDVFEDHTTVKNMLEFVSGVLSGEDLLNILSGKKMVVTFGATKGGTLTEKEKKLIAKAGAKIDEYLQITVMKQKQGENSQLVTELTRPVEFTLAKPKGSKSNCMIRLHKGKAEILEDVDKNPDTVTVRTDKFSPYAFGTEKKTSPLLPLAAGLALFLAAAAVLALIFKRRRSK